MTDDIHSQAYLYVVGALERDEVVEFEAHLAGCAECREEVADMREVAARLSDAVLSEPPAQLRSAVLARIAETAQDQASPTTASPAAGAAAPAAAGGRHAAPVTVRESDEQAEVVPIRRPWRERVVVLVAAAAVVAAAGFGGWALHGRNDARNDYATVKALNDELTSVLSAGDVQTASAQTKGGASTAVVRSPSRGVALLLASGLPALSGNKTYQAWTIDNDTATSAGTFESQGDQTIYALPGAAVSTGTVAITVEPAGGSEQPTSTPIVAIGLS